MKRYSRIIGRREFLRELISYEFVLASVLSLFDSFAETGWYDNRGLENELIDFAGGDSRILGVTKGNDPEEGFDIYCILTDKYDDDLMDKVNDLDIGLCKKYGFNGDISCYPHIADISETSLGEYIWKRN